MPELLEETSVKLDFADMLRRQQIDVRVKPRQPGVHQSGILYAIGKTIPSIAKHLKDGRFEEEYPLIWAMGQMWEEFCVSFYPSVIHQPGPKCKNGIWRSADGLIPEKRATARPIAGYRSGRLAEFKATYKKVRAGAEILDEWLWMHQGRGYASAYDVRLCEWHVFYVQGDYKAFGPVYIKYLVRFTDDEVQQTESMLVKNKHKATAEEGVSA